MRFWEYTYHSPWVFALFVLVPLLVWIQFRVSSRAESVAHSGFQKETTRQSWLNTFLFLLPTFLRVCAISSLLIALARPQKKLDNDTIKEQTIEGIDLVLSMDISQSMEALDFQPNRLGAAKKVAQSFIKKRPNDRIGLVVYEGESYTACALTTDHENLLNRFESIKSGNISGGTAIGMGIATAINRLKESEAKSKVIILLTDGENNTGKIHPITAAGYAKELGIRVYTVGIGSNGKVRVPGNSPLGMNFIDSKIDESMLREIASITNGNYYRAKNLEQLETIYSEIDKLEKSKINTIEYKRDLPEVFHPFVIVGILLLLLEFLARNFILRFTTD